MKKPKTNPWDAAEHLETAEDQTAYLDAALEEGDPALLAAVLSDIERAAEMTETDRNTG
jgi:probable addiction module antidote protein